MKTLDELKEQAIAQLSEALEAIKRPAHGADIGCCLIMQLDEIRKTADDILDRFYADQVPVKMQREARSLLEALIKANAEIKRLSGEVQFGEDSIRRLTN